MANPFIDKLAKFADLLPETRTALANATADVRDVAARRDLIREGDRPGPVLVMMEGWAFRYKVLPNGSRQITAFLMPGDACDLHVSLLGEMDHSIQAVTRARVARIGRVEMDALMTGHADFARAMYVAQLVDEGTLRAWIVSLGRRSSTERAAHLLLELFARAVSVGLGDRNQMEFPLSQAVLADALGMTSVHVNRVLQTLRLSGAVELQRGVLRIVNPVALTRLSGFDDNYLHRRLQNRESGWR